MNNLLDKILAYENGQLDRVETLELFQELVDTGLAWELQGHYGRTAIDLLHNGEILCPSHLQSK